MSHFHQGSGKSVDNALHNEIAGLSLVDIIVAGEVVVGGVIDGAVTATERLELQHTAVVNGDITTRSIVVMEGARINGGLKMTEIALVTGAEQPSDSREAKIARRS